MINVSFNTKFCQKSFLEHENFQEMDFLNRIWFFEPFEQVMMKPNLRDINDLARNLGLLFPDFWQKYTKIREKACSKFCEGMYGKPPSQIQKFAEMSIDKIEVPIEIHDFDVQKRSKNNMLNVPNVQYKCESVSRVSKCLISYMIDDFLDLLLNFEGIDKFLKNDAVSPKFFIKKDSKIEEILSIFSELIYNPKLESNLYLTFHKDFGKKWCQSTLNKFNHVNRVNLAYLWCDSEGALQITSSHIIYDNLETLKNSVNSANYDNYVNNG
jgi:hypothetical protein